MSEVPIIIGVGDVKNRDVNNAKEPATLMLEAIEIALKDASPNSVSDLKSAIDSIDVVKTWTWPYPDLPGLLAERLGVKMASTGSSTRSMVATSRGNSLTKQRNESRRERLK